MVAQPSRSKYFRLLDASVPPKPPPPPPTVDCSASNSLLQPIRDLALNWDIDVASALEDYLDDLEGISITLGEELRTAVTDPLAGDDAESVNFAEAALLIQVRAPSQALVRADVGRNISCPLTHAMAPPALLPLPGVGAHLQQESRVLVPARAPHSRHPLVAEASEQQGD